MYIVRITGPLSQYNPNILELHFKGCGEILDLTDTKIPY